MPTAKPRLGIIIGSTRPERMSKPIADWVYTAANASDKFDVELIDLAEINLPFFDEPTPPAMHQYTHDPTKRWAEIVDNLDAFIFVTPEHNLSFPAVLKNALDFLAIEWRDKAAVIVSYGGVDAGTRPAAQLQQVLHILGIKVTRSAVNIPFHFSREFSEGFPASEPEKKALEGALDEIASWEEIASWKEILRPLRAESVMS